VHPGYSALKADTQAGKATLLDPKHSSGALRVQSLQK